MGGGNPAPGGLAADDRQVLVRIICGDRYLLSAADEVMKCWGAIISLVTTTSEYLKAETVFDKLKFDSTTPCYELWIKQLQNLRLKHGIQLIHLLYVDV